MSSRMSKHFNHYNNMKKTVQSLALAFLLIGCATQPKQEFYEKHVAFPADATPEQKIDMASRIVPTPQQLEWQQMELQPSCTSV